MKDVTVINFYGGPGSGKSTAAAGLFYQMKIAGYNVELTDEFAKECVWEGNIPMLADQLWVLGHQHRKILRLSDKVDYIITDSPVLLSPIYRERYGEANHHHHHHHQHHHQHPHHHPLLHHPH